MRNIEIIFGADEVGHLLHNNQNYFCMNELCIDSVGKVVDNISGGYSLINTNLLKETDRINSKSYKMIKQKLLMYNSPEITFAILGFVAGCYLKERLWRLGIKFPHL